MSAESKKSAALSVVLIAFGVVALFTGSRFLPILVPAAILVYYGTALSTMHNSIPGAPVIQPGANQESEAKLTHSGRIEKTKVNPGAANLAKARQCGFDFLACTTIVRAMIARTIFG